MLARRMLLGFALFLVVMSALLWQLAGFSPVPAVITAVVILVAARAAVVLLGFVAAGWLGAKRPAESQIGWATTAGMVARELRATLQTFFVLHPLEPWLTGPPATGGAGIPVVLVHGFFSNAAYWWAMQRFLAMHGLTNVHNLNLEPPFGDIDGYLTQLAVRVDALGTAAGPVVLIGHSMGGLVCRALVESGRRPGRVAKIVTLATPHHGTLAAWLMIGANVRQMRPGSTWLNRLNRKNGGSVPIVSIYSYHDNIVVPAVTAKLDGAKNVPVPGVGHLEMGFSPVIMDLVHDEIKSVQRNC